MRVEISDRIYKIYKMVRSCSMPDQSGRILVDPNGAARLISKAK